MGDVVKKGQWGGVRENSGRPPKVKEQKLIEALTPLHDIAISQLEVNIMKGEAWAVKMFMEYFYGKPKETKDLNVKGLPKVVITYLDEANDGLQED